MALIKPKPLTVATQDGDERQYIISRFPALDGREIIAQYPVSMIPKLGEYAVNKTMALKILSFVCVALPDGKELQLTTADLVNNHVPDWETMAKIEMAMMEYNCSFFARGKTSSLFEGLEGKAQLLITKILTVLSAQSSKPGEPPSTS